MRPRTPRAAAVPRFAVPSVIVLVAVVAVAFWQLQGGDADEPAVAGSSESSIVLAAEVEPTATAELFVAPATPSGGGATATSTPAAAGVAAASSTTVPSGLAATATATTKPVRAFPPNELGQILILQYHHFGPVPDQFVRTPEQFRADLQWLYDNGFYVVNLNDVLTDNIDIPAGKRPVVLTFDDSPASQFSLSRREDGRLVIDPDCAVGIMEAFFRQHPDFGHGGHFAVLPSKLFDWTPTEHRGDQTTYAVDKLRWLVARGYEIGNHTVDHANLAKLSPNEIKHQLATATDALRKIVPESPVDVITLPYGGQPSGDNARLLRGFQYQERWYVFVAVLLVGSNPDASPVSTQFDPYAINRVQAFDEELEHWKQVFADNPGILYVSDGDPETVTVPNDLHPSLAGTLDESKTGDRKLVRY